MNLGDVFKNANFQENSQASNMPTMEQVRAGLNKVAQAEELTKIAMDRYIQKLGGPDVVEWAMHIADLIGKTAAAEAMNILSGNNNQSAPAMGNQDVVAQISSILADPNALQDPNTKAAIISMLAQLTDAEVQGLVAQFPQLSPLMSEIANIQ